MPPSYDEVERAIARVPGVAAATVGASGAGESKGKLRIRLAPGHDPDTVAVAVAAELRTSFGIQIDPAAIRPRPDTDDDEAAPEDGASSDEVPSVAAADGGAHGDAPDAAAGGETDGDAAVQDMDVSASPAVEQPVGEQPASAEQPVGEETVAGGPAAEPGTNGHRPARPIIRELLLGTQGLEVQVEAILALAGQELRGVARAAATRRATFRAVARATLDAVEALAPGMVKTELESIELLDTGDDERVTVTLTLLTEEGAEQLIGVSMSRGDAERATMRATLDALNRRVGLLLEEADRADAGA